MTINTASVLYSVAGGLILYSGVKGATLADTAKAVLTGNLTLANTEPIQFPATASPGGSSNAGTGSGPGGAALLAEAEKYNGHKYVLGGPSNPTSGWDCSSAMSFWLGAIGMNIPGGSWKSVTNNGAIHGPTAAEYLSWSGATTVATSQVQPGDLLCWPTHVGLAVDATHMFSAYDTADGTLQTPWAGPSGEGAPKVRRVNQLASGSGAATAGFAYTGNQTQDAITLGKYLMTAGLSRAAAAGVCGCVAGEAVPPFNPESVGSGGFGLIGWTGNTIGGAHAPTGNAQADWQNQIKAIVGYIQAVGSISDMNANSPDPVSAADHFSSHYEKPKVPLSDVRASVATQVFASI